MFESISVHAKIEDCERTEKFFKFFLLLDVVLYSL